MAKDPVERRPDGRSPLELACLGPTLEPEPELDLVSHKVTEHGSDRAQLIKFVEDQPDDVLDLLVGVQLELVAGRERTYPTGTEVNCSPLRALFNRAW